MDDGEMAERERFELSEVLPSPAFEAGALDQLCDLSRYHDRPARKSVDVAPSGGIGPPTHGLGNRCSIH
jgi:hypothetical protein